MIRYFDSLCLIPAQTGNIIITMCDTYGKTGLNRAKQGQTVLSNQGGIRKDNLVEKI